MMSYPNNKSENIAFPDFEISTHDARWLDEGFLSLHSSAIGELLQPAVIEGLGKMFPVLVPHQFHEYPVWFFLLPDELSPELAQLKKAKPIAHNFTSVDLLQNQSFISWPGVTCHLLFKASKVDRTLTRATQVRWLLVMFVTPTRTLLTRIKISEDFMDTLWLCSMCAGGNYNPCRVFSESELDAAKERVRHAESRWIYPDDDEGRRPLYLFGCSATGYDNFNKAASTSDEQQSRLSPQGNVLPLRRRVGSASTLIETRVGKLRT